MLYLIPFITAIVGWLIHRVFVTFLLTKTIPAQQAQIAAKAGVLAAAQLNMQKIAGNIADSSQLAALKPDIERHIDTFLNEKLKEKFPMIAMFAGEKTMDKIKEGLMEEIDLLLPAILKKVAGNLDAKLDIESMVRNKIATMDNAVFATKVKEALGSYVGRLTFLGALAGFACGWVAVLCFSLIK